MRPSLDSVQPLLLSEEIRTNAEDHFILFFTGLQRTASDIATAQINNVDKKQNELRGISELVSPATDALKKGDMETFGKLLHESWLLKRSLSDKISTTDMDSIYNSAIETGAYGGKILGAGGGGFFLFCVHPSKRQALIDKLGLLWMPVSFEFGGSQTVLV